MGAGFLLGSLSQFSLVSKFKCDERNQTKNRGDKIFSVELFEAKTVFRFGQLLCEAQSF